MVGFPTPVPPSSQEPEKAGTGKTGSERATSRETMQTPRMPSSTGDVAYTEVIAGATLLTVTVAVSVAVAPALFLTRTLAV